VTARVAATEGNECIMGLFDTLTRSLTRLATSPYEANGAERAGALGEAMAAEVVATAGNILTIANPIVPHPHLPAAWLESDMLVYAYGKLFCIEVKNYHGRITYPKESQFGASNQTQIVQIKQGRYGESLLPKQYPNPLRKTTGFIHHLKRYLSRYDARYGRVFITPVVAFGPQADIRDVHDPAAGMIAVTELESYLRGYGRPLGDPAAPQWMAAMFSRVASWDWVCTTRGEWHYGVLQPEVLRYVNAQDERITVPWWDLSGVMVRPGSLFGDDALTLELRNGQRAEDRCRTGGLGLTCGGHNRPFDLHHLRQVLVKVSGTIER